MVFTKVYGSTTSFKYLGLTIAWICKLAYFTNCPLCDDYFLTGILEIFISFWKDVSLKIFLRLHSTKYIVIV